MAGDTLLVGCGDLGADIGLRLAALGHYVVAIRRYPAPAWRVACFAGAIVLLLAVAVTPIHTLGMHFLLTMHLLQNVVLAEWAPLLIVLGIPPALGAAIAIVGSASSRTTIVRVTVVGLPTASITVSAACRPVSDVVKAD